MTFVMSFQYPSPSLGGSEMDMPHTPYHPGYSLPSQQQSSTGGADPRTSHLSMHDSRDSGLGLRRSFSTPNAVPFPGPGFDQAQGGMPAEKKRNKLGYHRSSVACVHCRKRKIRCVADTNDKQGRCTNCMRLKKDCSFLPVDQLTPLESRGKSLVRSSGSQRNPSASASPATSSGHPSEAHSKRPLSRQILPSGLGHPGDDDDRTSISDTSSGRQAGHSFELSSQPSVTWGSGEIYGSIHNKSRDFPGQWHPGGALGDQFSPYEGMPASPGWHPDTQGQPPHDSFPWGSVPGPVRSLSYSGDAMPGHQQAPYDPASHGLMYDRRASNFTGVYSSALGGTLSTVEPDAHHSMDGNRTFSTGSGAAQGSMLWEGEPGQPGQESFPKQEGYDGWAYGHNGTGHP